MADIIKNFQINLNLISKTRINPIVVSKGDLNTVLFAFTITENSERVDLTNAEVRLFVLKPSGLSVNSRCVVTNPLQGECETILLNQALLEQAFM